MFSVGQNMPWGSVEMFHLGDKSHWGRGDMCPKQYTASAVRSTQPETRVCPRGLWHDWQTKRAMHDFPADHNFLTITACVSTKTGSCQDTLNWEKGKLEAAGIQPRLQKTQLSYVFFCESEQGFCLRSSLTSVYSLKHQSYI